MILELKGIPNPKQAEFFRSTARHTAYGGARGGGKSWAMRRKLVLLALNYPGLNALIMRRTLPELRENHVIPLLKELKGAAKYNAAERVFKFPNGSRLRLGYCDSASDVYQYQGQEYEVIGFEEATNFEPDWLTFIATCLRTTRTDFVPRIYYTCNPGGPGHAYIKRLFIDRAFRDGEDPADYVFIPAKVYDNQVLMQRDPGYLKRLEALPPARRRAHLEGDWNVYEGQVFAEWRDDPAHYADGKWTHVIEPFDIPDTWRVYRSFDFGYAKPFSVGWWAVDFDGRLYRILELYGCVPGEPDTGADLRADPHHGDHAPLSARPGHSRRGRPRDLGRVARRQHRRHRRPVRRVLRARRPQAPARLDAGALPAGVRSGRAADAVRVPQLPGYAAHTAAAALRRTRARGRGHAAGGPHRRRDPVSVPVRPHRAAARGAADAKSVRPAEQRMIM